MAAHSLQVRNATLPPLKSILERPFSDQVAVFKKVAAKLEQEKVSLQEGDPRSVEFIPRLGTYLAQMSAHWEFMRKECLENPDFFEWPTTKAWIGIGKLDTSNFTSEGVLGIFGYAVSAASELSEAERRGILDLVFDITIPPVTHWHHIVEWGEPGSVQRLKKMANCLASFARNASRRRDHNMTHAVHKWCRDLEYVRVKYYDGKFRFDWPSTSLL